MWDGIFPLKKAEPPSIVIADLGGNSLKVKASRAGEIFSCERHLDFF